MRQIDQACKKIQWIDRHYKKRPIFDLNSFSNYHPVILKNREEYMKVRTSQGLSFGV